MRNVAGCKLQVEGDVLTVIPDTRLAVILVAQKTVIPATHPSVIPACLPVLRQTGPESSSRKDSRQAGVTNNLSSFLLCSCFMALLFCLVMVSLPNHAHAFNLPDTGQTKCYRDVDPYDEIPCAGTGQDGAYTINTMSFSDNGNGTVTDNNTGFMWQKCSVGQNNDATCSGTAVTYNWYQASGTYDSSYNPSSTDVCGSLVFGGYSDWRLPAKKELMSIVDYSIPDPGPTINTTYFPNTKSSYYWSSATLAVYPSLAWGVGFDGKGANGYVRCVRGGQYPSQSFTDNGNGTVTDNKTGLVWQQGEPGEMSWGSALSYCEGLSLGGSTDWRLPNIKELESLTDDTRYSPAINTTYFPNTISSYYWSSTTSASYPYYACDVYFFDGYVYRYYKDFNYYVRCVRGGQSGSFDYFCDGDSDGYFDSVKDGTCTGSGCVPSGCQTTAGDDCNDSDSSTYPGADDSNCNGIDENCNGTADDGYVPSGTNCGLGVCASTGQLICVNGQTQDTCQPGQPTGNDDNCNGIDENCDGIADNNYVHASTLCGIGVCSSTGELSCVNGVTIDSCTPGTPQTEVCDGIDNDCDGQIDEGCMPDLVISALAVPSTATAGQSITISETTKNQGTASAGASTTKYYLSTNATYETGDTLLGNRSIPSLTSGSTSRGRARVTIPSGTTAGTYYIISKADANNAVTEANEKNNNKVRAITIQ
ncbi:MAG: DUF1566 domain-containing protein [Nitrospirae bacterium]|nr:DUF1566 domain-containing protein [Nitrospirota bacterium]